MKPSRERLELSTYPSRVDIPARFSDVDMFRHLNNVAIGQFYEEVRFALTAQAREMLPKGSGRIMVANVDTAFLREAQYPGTVTVGTGVARRGGKSFVFGQALFQDGVCFSAADTTLVFVGPTGPAVLPPELDAFLNGLQLPSFVDERAAG
jgi:acyl-CoA thioester hydrolase